MAGQEYLIGESFSRDGSDYDPFAPTPTWAQIIDVATRAVKDLSTPFSIIFLGLGVGSDGTRYPVDIPNGNSGVVTRRALLQTVYRGISGSQIEAATTATQNPDNTAKWAQELMQMPNRPGHIYGVVIKA